MKKVLLSFILLWAGCNILVAQESSSTDNAWFARASALGTFTDRSPFNQGLFGFNGGVGRQWKFINIETYLPNIYFTPKQSGISGVGFYEKVDVRYLPLGWQKVFSPYIMGNAVLSASKQDMDRTNYYNPNDPNDPYIPTRTKYRHAGFQLSPGIGTYINIGNAWAIDLALPTVFGLLLFDFEHTTIRNTYNNREVTSKSKQADLFSTPYHSILPYAQVGILYRIVR